MSLPERQYELAGRLLAAAVDEAGRTGESPRTVLDRHSRACGRHLAEDAREHGTPDDREALMRTLANCGFEPRAADPDVVLVNCPFHNLAQAHTELVCGMNLCLLTGLLEGLPGSGLSARLDPAPDLCCVRLTPAEHERAPQHG